VEAKIKPMADRANSRFGSIHGVIGRNFSLLRITIFAVASFLCGIAPSMPILVSVFGRHHRPTPRFRKRHPLLL
jgi:hypothetical protein